MRDNFPAKGKEMLAKRVAFLCSNPACNMTTVGPQQTKSAVINIGVAAHITAASPDGPRYDVALNAVKRRDIENGIWLCQSCAKLVDSDLTTYTEDLLRQWKKGAEERAKNRLNRQMQIAGAGWETNAAGMEPIQEGGYYEKQMAGYKIKYFLQDDKLHVEQELTNGSVGYYVIDSHGNMLDHKFPYALSEYSVEIDPSLVLRRESQILSDGATKETISMKWGKKAVIVWETDHHLRDIHVENGCRMDHIRKVFVFETPEFNVSAAS